MKIIVYPIYLIVSSLVLAEILVRFNDHLIPASLAEHLSSGALAKVHHDHGKLQDESGVYYYRPFKKIPFEPWIAIDEIGFRNSAANQLDAEYVLLCDSIIFARDAREDLGNHFRSKGMTALNLGMEGYAPQHYRETYRKFVINKGIKHKYVIVNVFVGNDFNDQNRYPWKLSTQGSGVGWLPWALNLAMGTIKNFQSQATYDLQITNGEKRVALPYKEIGVGYLWWQGKPDESQFAKINGILSDIVTKAKSVGATPVLVIFPSPAAVYGRDAQPDFRNFYEAHKNIVKMFRKAFKELPILDPNDALADAVLKKFIFVSDSDCHLNDYGNEVFFQFLSDNLEGLS